MKKYQIIDKNINRFYKNKLYKKYNIFNRYYNVNHQLKEQQINLFAFKHKKIYYEYEIDSCKLREKMITNHYFIYTLLDITMFSNFGITDNIPVIAESIFTIFAIIGYCISRKLSTRIGSLQKDLYNINFDIIKCEEKIIDIQSNHNIQSQKEK